MLCLILLQIFDQFDIIYDVTWVLAKNPRVDCLTSHAESAFSRIFEFPDRKNKKRYINVFLFNIHNNLCNKQAFLKKKIRLIANWPMCHDVLPDCNNSTLTAQYIRTLCIKHMRSGFFFVIISAWVHVQMRSIFWKICQHCCIFACEISNIRGKRTKRFNLLH